jgi:hypothetical protein
VEHRAFPHVQAIGEALKSIGGEFFTYSDSGHDTRLQGFPVLGTSDAAAPALAGTPKNPLIENRRTPPWRVRVGGGRQCVHASEGWVLRF